MVEDKVTVFRDLKYLIVFGLKRLLFVYICCRYISIFRNQMFCTSLILGSMWCLSTWDLEQLKLHIRECSVVSELIITCSTTDALQFSIAEVPVEDLLTISFSLCLLCTSIPIFTSTFFGGMDNLCRKK